MTKQTKQFGITVKEARDDGGRIAINTLSVDRDRDRVMPSGALIQSYMSNPVVQWGHNYREPWSTIGRTNELIIDAKEIVADFTLRPAANEQDPQNIIRLLWSGGWVNAASVGFRANREMMEENDHGGWDFLEWELLEWSLVPIPANQDALRRAVKAFDERADVVDSVIEVACAVCGEAYGCTRALSALVLTGDVPRLCPDCAERAPVVMQAYAQGAPSVLVTDSGISIALSDPAQIRHLIHTGPDGVESKVVVPYKDYGTSRDDWEAPSLDDFTDEQMADLDDDERERIAEHYTWSATMPPETFGDLKLPHHAPQVDGVGPAVWEGVYNAMAALMGAMGGVDVPEDDEAAIYDHLVTHYEQFDEDPPEMEAYDENALRELFPDVMARGMQQGPGADADTKSDSDDDTDKEPGPASEDADDELPPEVLKGLEEAIGLVGDLLQG